MHLSNLASVAAPLLGFAAAAPPVPRSYGVPNDGFPNPNAQQLLAIETQADGTLSNAPPPPTLASSSLTAFQLIAFNENFEVAFFSSLVNNITTGVGNFNLPTPENQNELISILKTVLAQEELHAISALQLLTHFGAFAPPPCTYNFPTTDVVSAIRLAETFTAVVMGTLQDASQLLAKNGDDGPVRTVASIIGQEGEQNGFYRTLLGFKPSEKPFLTTSIAAYAFSVLQTFVAECPFPISDIAIPVFTPLSVLSGNGGTDVAPQDQTLTFSANLAGVEAAAKFVGGDGSGLFVTYLSGQLLPISEPVTNVRWDGSSVTFDALFPFTENIMYALTIASLTTSDTVVDPDDLPGVTLAAPGLIQVNDRV